MISVVIPAYNEEGTIEECIKALLTQKTSQDYEVIIVDNSSTDRTSKILKKFKNDRKIVLLNEPKKGRGQARFAGFRKARGDIILSTDADSIVPPTWIDRMLIPFEDPKVVAVTGTGRIEDCSERINKTFNLAQPFSMVLYRLVFRHYWLSGFNFAIRSETYKKAGGFNPEINSNEDLDLSFRVTRCGKIEFLKGSTVTVSGRRVRRSFIKGVVPYFTSYVKYFALKKPPTLTDVR